MVAKTESVFIACSVNLTGCKAGIEEIHGIQYFHARRTLESIGGGLFVIGIEQEDKLSMFGVNNRHVRCQF